MCSPGRAPGREGAVPPRVSLEAERGVVTAIYDGAGPAHEPEAPPLSRIIENLNEKFGLNAPLCPSDSFGAAFDLAPL